MFIRIKHMPLHHQYIVLDAVLQATRSVISKNAEQHGTILATRQPHVLVAQTEAICYVYTFSVIEGSIKKTRLDLAITRDTVAAVALVESVDLIGAMNALPEDTSADDTELAQTHLLMLKQLMSPIPTALAAKKAHEMQEREAAPLYGVPVMTLTKVWFFFFLLGGIFSATLLLALNWWNMGYKRKAFSTIGVMFITWITCIVPTILILSQANAKIDYTWSSIFAFIIILPLSMSILLWQARVQRPLYQTSVDRYGKPSIRLKRNVLLVGVAVLIGVGMGSIWPNILYAAITKGSSVLTQAASRVTHADSYITVQYPSDWRKTDIYRCKDKQECLIEIAYPAGIGSIIGVRTANYFTLLSSLKQVVDASWQSTQSQYTNLSDYGLFELKIDGRKSFLRVYISTNEIMLGYQKINVSLESKLLYIQDGDDFIAVQVTTAPELSNTANAIINSVHFVKPRN
jgi:hypothetical protein